MRMLIPALAALLSGTAWAQNAPLVAQACLSCHGLNGAGAGAVPALAGRDRAELAAQMIAFRANERPGTIMGRIARGYSDAEIASSAEYFSRQGR